MLFAFALVIMLVIKTFVIQGLYIPSGSMEKTLEIGDRVLVNKMIYHFRSTNAGRSSCSTGRVPGIRPVRPSR